MRKKKKMFKSTNWNFKHSGTSIFGLRNIYGNTENMAKAGLKFLSYFKWTVYSVTDFIPIGFSHNTRTLENSKNQIFNSNISL